jgi:hypothetical protein
MIDAKDVVVWINNETHQILIRPLGRRHRPDGSGWGDPIGAAYAEWGEASDEQRILLMLETVIDLAMQGFPIKEVVKAFAEVREFRALGGKSTPMCRALTSALLGRCLEANTMSFDDLLVRYAPRDMEHTEQN